MKKVPEDAVANTSSGDQSTPTRPQARAATASGAVTGASSKRLWVIEAVDEKMGKPLGLDDWRLYVMESDQWGGLGDAMIFEGMGRAYAKYRELEEKGLLWRQGVGVRVQLLKNAKAAAEDRERKLATRSN